MSDYTEKIYIEANGNDETGNGSKSAPYATIENALIKATTTNPAFYIGKGTFYISRIVGLTVPQSHTNNIFGSGLKTRIMVNKLVMEDDAGDMNVYDCVFQPIDNPTGNDNLRSLFYTPATSGHMNFYNCVFLKSSNGTYPTTTLLYGSSSSYSFTNKSFYNCTSNISQVSRYGLPKFANCAFLYPASVDGTANANVTDCKNNIKEYDATSFKLTDENTVYGVYSGDHAWKYRKYLIYQNEKYYSINSKYFNGETYDALTGDDLPTLVGTDGFDISELMTEVTLSEKTFKPIDKFTGKIQLVSTESFGLNVTGLKTTRELVLAKDMFSTKIADNIDFFNLNYSATSDGAIKSAISDDSGKTWKTWNDKTSTWDSLSTVPPLKNYSDLSTEEITAWNAFRDEVYEKGFVPKESLGADYNKLSDTLMFAYVLERPAYTDSISMDTLKYQFDAKGSFEKTDTDEVGLKQTEDQILVTPAKDMSLLRVNIGNYTKGDKGESSYDIAVRNGFEGSEKDWLNSLKGSSAELSGYTDEEISNSVKLLFGSV